MADDRIVAIITARGGSKGVARKNVRSLAGKPLLTYTIAAAGDCSAIDRVFVSTEDAEIRDLSLREGVEVVDRPDELASDSATSAEVIVHALTALKQLSYTPRFFVLLQPTSPLRTARHVRECIEQFQPGRFGSAVSMTVPEHHPFKSLVVEDNGGLTPLRNWEDLERPRQQLPKVLIPNGAIYLAGRERFLEEKTFFIQPVMPYLMDARSSIDIDTKADLVHAEFLLCQSPEMKT